MKDPVCVQILQAEGHLDKEFPNLAFSQVLAHLALQELAQVLILTQLHHNVQLVTRLERIVETNHVLVVQFIHQVGLADRLHFLLLAHSGKIYLLEHVDGRVLLSDNAINDTK